MKLIFVHVPKTAGTSIWTLLKNQGLIDRGVEHKKLSEYDTTDAITVGSCRNPFDRLVSVWAYMLAGGNGVDDTEGQEATPEDFGDFVRRYLRDGEPYPKREFLTPQVEYLFDGDKRVDELIRFEWLGLDWAKFSYRARLPAFLPRTRKSEHKNWRQYYDDELRGIVRGYYADDFERLGYE